jgi:two-component sensor histidine kinase
VAFLRYHVDGGLPVGASLLQPAATGAFVSAVAGVWTARAPSRLASIGQVLLFIAVGYVLALHARAGDVTSAVFAWLGGFLAFEYGLMRRRRSLKLLLMVGTYVMLLASGLWLRSDATPLGALHTIATIAALVYATWFLVDRRWARHVERSDELERRVRARTAELAAGLDEAQKLSDRLEIALRKETDLKQQKELLLREVHHRTKNNMQMVSSLISLELSNVADPDTAIALENSTRRVRALAVVHEELHRSSNLAVVDLATYLRSLVRNLRSSVSSSRVTIEVDAPDSAPADVDTAIPLGLIVNELVHHAVMHALLEASDGWVSVSLASDDEHYLLALRDNGCKVPCGGEDSEHEEEDRVSLSLVRGLAAQLHGELSYRYDEGARWSLRFPKQTSTSAQDRLPTDG